MRRINRSFLQHLSCFIMSTENCLANLATLQKSLGYRFSDESFLEQALTHPSFAYESRERDISDNGRLEFLGDSILGLVVSEHLYKKSRTFSEGQLTRHRSLLVNRTYLSKKAHEAGLPRYLRLGKGEDKMGGRQNATNLAGALEAVIGAIYIDGGFDKAEKFIMRHVVKK